MQDEAKGEALVLLSAVDIDIAELRKKLQEAGVPNLWIPKHVQRVEAIPVLASGKLDLKRCQELVLKGKRHSARRGLRSVLRSTTWRYLSPRWLESS